MKADRCPLSDVVEPVKMAFGVEESSARNLLREAIGEGEEVMAEAHVSCFLTLERELPSPTGNMFVIRQWAVPDAKAA
jgi:hypothetical protein